ncbi:hypothetical protein ID866_11458 [Astraeus odoratus]|nr:hypothetical protein ID866_11458 [Astraeus odoratus]
MSLFGFIFLALTIVGASPDHFDIAKVPFSHTRDPKCVEASHNNQLGKRDGIVFVQKEGNYYIAPVLTSSGNKFNLAVDTGSPYTWLGAREENPYVQGYASHPTRQIINLRYGGGEIHLRANTYRDLVVLGGFTINPQEIGIPIELNGFPDYIDGILGLGPSRLMADFTEDGSIVPTVVDNLYSQGTISSPLLGIYFWPINVGNVGGPDGILSFGSIDASALTTDVQYVPVTQSLPASHYWAVDASIAYGNMPILGLTPGILDTGSIGIYVPGASPVTLIDTFVAYKSATGAAIDFFGINRLLTITEDQYDDLQMLSILVGDQSYDLSPNAQIFPRISPDEQIYLVIKSSDIGTEFTLGSSFLCVFTYVLLGFADQASI